MKTKSVLPLLRYLLIPLLATATLARADDAGTTATVKLSAPGKPATLRIELPWANIKIAGGDGDAVTVASTISQKGSEERRPDGLRRLDDDVSFELTEHDNVVSLRLAGENPWASHDGDFIITVPRSIALDVKTDAGGDLEIKDIAGDIEINNMNGGVVLDGISGSTVVNTMNGEVHATYAKAPTKLVSITSMNGEVDLRLPAETKANVRLRTHNGSILTDFDEKVLQTTSEVRGSDYGEGGANAARLGADVARLGAEAARIANEAVHNAMEIAHQAKEDAERSAREMEQDRERADKLEAEVAAEHSDKEAPEARTDRAPGHNPHMAPLPPHNPRPPHAPHAAPRAPFPPITGGKIVSGTLNGGGVDIKISTMNGEITLRQAK